MALQAVASARHNLYSIVIAIHPDTPPTPTPTAAAEPDWRVGEITVDWVDFTREKSVESSLSAASHAGGGAGMSSRAGPSRRRPTPSSGRLTGHGSGPAPHPPSPSELSLQPLLAHVPGPNPLDSSVASGVSHIGRGIVHLFRHAPPAALIASLDAHPVGESSRSTERSERAGRNGRNGAKTPVGRGAAPALASEGDADRDRGKDDWAGARAEGEDGSLIAILAVPAWMRPADFLEFIGGWGTCLEGVRMIREATTPNRSIVLLKFRDPLQASDFLVIFTGRPFSTLDTRETCHPIRIHHLVLHQLELEPYATSASAPASPGPDRVVAVPAFPPSVYSSRVKALPALLTGVPDETKYELPSCPVCLERLDSTVTGLVTLPCAHTFDCDCLRKWGDSRCPVCRVSHLLLSSTSAQPLARGASGSASGPGGHGEITRITKCSICAQTSNNWICVVCGVVGCGRYDPGKGHARRHWEESGHVLAMELETQRVWDYKGDNYVHRLIQTKNDGKLVELPSAASLVTSQAAHLPRSSASTLDRLSGSPSAAAAAAVGARNRTATRRGTTPTPPSSNRTSLSSADAPGPSHDDVEKISTIESITLEYSYLLSSQLEAMRQHYESLSLSTASRLSELEAAQAAGLARQAEHTQAAQAALARADKAERRAERAADVARALQASLASERSMAEGLQARIRRLGDELDRTREDKRAADEERRELQGTVRDLMFTLEAGARIQEGGGGVEEGVGGDLVVLNGSKGKKKGKK